MEGKFQFIISTSKRTCHCEEMSINEILLNYLFSLLIRKMTAVFWFKCAVSVRIQRNQYIGHATVLSCF